jgi:hypothetical protein
VEIDEPWRKGDWAGPRNALYCTLPVLAERLDRVLTVRTQLTTCRGILGTVAISIEC